MAVGKRRVGLKTALRQELDRVEELIDAWWGKGKGQEGRAIDKESTDRILALQKQRVTLLQALEELKQATNDEKPRPVEIVFVDDWRQEVE